MGKVDRLRTRVEPFLICFWLSAMYLPHVTMPAGPTSLKRSTQSMSLNSHSWFNSQEDTLPPPFSYLGMLFIYGCSYRLYLENKLFDVFTYERSQAKVSTVYFVYW